MLRITPNFHFGGQCEQALRLYEKAFNARTAVILRNADANPDDYATTENERNYVYHAEIYIGEQRLIMNDAANENIQQGNSLSLIVTFESAEEVKEAFKIMSDGAVIVSPMQKTTYSSCFVSLIDRYGMRWELMTEQTEK